VSERERLGKSNEVIATVLSISGRAVALTRGGDFGRAETV
jgi:hypothetical protein